METTGPTDMLLDALEARALEEAVEAGALVLAEMTLVETGPMGIVLAEMTLVNGEQGIVV